MLRLRPHNKRVSTSNPAFVRHQAKNLRLDVELANDKDKRVNNIVAKSNLEASIAVK
jgi:hypothetical protein